MLPISSSHFLVWNSKSAFFKRVERANRRAKLLRWHIGVLVPLLFSTLVLSGAEGAFAQENQAGFGSISVDASASATDVPPSTLNLNGKATLEQGVRPAGEHSVTFDAAHLSSGLYLYRITTPGFTQTRKMLLVK